MLKQLSCLEDNINKYHYDEKHTLIFTNSLSYSDVVQQIQRSLAQLS